ncbi:uncharacterized protein LOC125039974 [Penaeus chinensis]|uniref:uncharacterized protein LOC125039974 n=1 Tax=Penaeus chinensis TaxID=139456 RepID=UPI001FB58533|nr:uncharacterized protein LOC125039974 [Penaeus chinensis]
MINEKKSAQRTHARVGTEQSREANKRAKRAVARPKAEAMSKFFEDLETKEGQKNIFRIAKARDKAPKDIVHIKDNNGSVLTRESVGPDEIPTEAWKCLGDEGVDILLDLLRKIYQHVKIPDIWRERTLVPIYKDNGNYRIAETTGG